MKAKNAKLFVAASALLLLPLQSYAAYDWSGLTVGLSYGNVDGSSKPTGLFQSITDYSGVDRKMNYEDDAWGGEISYDYQDAKGIVVGVILEQSDASIDDHVNDGNYLSYTSELDSFGSIKLRFGYAFDRLLPYVTFGMGWADVKNGQKCANNPQQNGTACGVQGYDVSDSQTLNDTVYGFGVKYAVLDNFIVGVDYTKYDLGDETYTWSSPSNGFVPINPGGGNFETNFDIVKMNLGYKF